MHSFQQFTEAASVKTQKYSWGTMKTVHHGASFSIPLHPEHHQAIHKLKDGESHSFTDETKSKWKATREGDKVHFHGEGPGNRGYKTTVSHEHMKEEVEIEEAKDTVEKDAQGNIKSWKHESDWVKSKGNGTTVDKSGAKHTPYSKARDLARAALKKSLAKEEAEIEEELKGKQHKLDKNKNGKLDAHDFKLLRKEEEELDEAYGVNLGSRPVSGQKEYQGKEIKSFHPNKEKEAREYAKKHGYVVKKKELPKGSSNITHTWDIHKEETELEEGTFVYHMNKAIAAHERGDAKKKQMHLDNAKTARYSMKSTEIAKHKDLLDKYSQMREEVELTEEKHRVLVTLSDPNHSMTSQRKEKIQKHIRVTAGDHGQAVAKAKAHYQKQGYKVHDAEHVGMVKEEALDEAGAYQKDMDEKKPVYAQGVKGMKSKPFTKKFKTMDHYNKWADSEKSGDHEVHRVYQEEIEQILASAEFAALDEESKAAIFAYIEHISEGVSHDSKARYEYSNGKKPSGHGNWMFSTVHPREHDVEKHKDQTVSVQGTFSDASKKAAAHFKSKGHKGEIHVLP